AQPGLPNALDGNLLFVGAIGEPQLRPVNRLHGRRRYASWPWQCLYFRPEPHGQGALRLTGASTTPPPASRCGNGGCGILSGGRFDKIAPVDASMSAVS